MQFNRISYVIAALAIALMALFAFQVKWLFDSQQFIEEQFDEKVRLALCYAVGNTVVETPQVCQDMEGCTPLFQDGDDFKVESSVPFESTTLDSILADAFAFYAIDMDYETEVVEQDEFKTFGEFPTYQCALNPLEKNETHILRITFPEKRNYVFGKMKFMFFSSIIILLFITSVFIFASYTLLRQKRMAQINKEFFNNLAHEFRTPLTNITLAGNLLAKKINEPTHQKYLNVVHDESKKLKHQVERVLHLANLENGEYQLAKENLCPKTLIEDVIKGMEIQIKEKRAKVFFQSKEGLSQLQGDKFHLGNAFRNLLDNALKYSCATPEINIRMSQEKDGTLIQFEDNGIGICKKDQKGVFNKYQRVNNGDLHNQKGFGLGLAYVKMIVEKHKGAIKIFSDLNKGTRFDLFFPKN